MIYFNRIKLELDRAGHSQGWLAEQIGKTPHTVSSFCRNESQPKLDDLYAIANALKISVTKLLIPNEYSLPPRLTVPKGPFEAQALNAIIYGMQKKDGTSSLGYFYYNNRNMLPEAVRTNILSEGMFYKLADILKHDDIVNVSNLGALSFTETGLFIATDFQENQRETTQHIGYEARWYEVMHHIYEKEY